MISRRRKRKTPNFSRMAIHSTFPDGLVNCSPAWLAVVGIDFRATYPGVSVPLTGSEGHMGHEFFLRRLLDGHLAGKSSFFDSIDSAAERKQFRELRRNDQYG